MLIFATASNTPSVKKKVIREILKFTRKKWNVEDKFHISGATFFLNDKKPKKSDNDF